MKLDKRACRHAANAPLNISLNAGVLYTERVKCLVTAAVKLLGGHRALAVYLARTVRLRPSGVVQRIVSMPPRRSIEKSPEKHSAQASPASSVSCTSASPVKPNNSL